MVHLLKLAVGIRDMAHLRVAQAERGRADPPLRHRTRQMPKRAEEIIAGGSIYWVIGGIVECRQRILDIVTDTKLDGVPCAALLLDPELVPVAGRPVKPFQGWRYLNRNEAPPDLSQGAAGDEELPPTPRRALVDLCLL